MNSTRYGVRDEVRETAEAFYRAISNRNMKSLDAVWAHVPYAAVAGPVGQIHQGWPQVASFWAERFQQLEGIKVSVKLVGMVCHVVGDVAWLSGKERRVVTRDDAQHTEELRVTCVMQRASTGWQLVSYHASLPAEVLALASAS